MKKLLTATLVLSFVLVTGTAFAKGPMNKATGTIWMSNPDQMTSFVAFDAGVSSPDDHGNAEYSNFTYPADTPEGYLHYTASVLCATVSDMDARYMYQIPEGFPGLSGLYVLSAVHDGGTSGTNGDTYGHTATSDLATAMSWCENGTGVSNYPITAGNLVVHTH